MIGGQTDNLNGVGMTIEEATQAINAENPDAVIETIPEMWQLLNDALPIIEAEADQRDGAMRGPSAQNDECEPYWTEMRDLADRIEALIFKATARK